MSRALRTEGLGKAFTLHLQGGAHIPVLQGVELAVAPGECVALAGPLIRHRRDLALLVRVDAVTEIVRQIRT